MFFSYLSDLMINVLIYFVYLIHEEVHLPCLFCGENTLFFGIMNFE